MTFLGSANIAATDGPAIMQAYRWLDGVTLTDDKPLINVSQAAPAVAPPEPLRQHMAELMLHDTAAHLYGPDLGYDPLRSALADNIAAHYGGAVSAEQVAITAGCNHAYAATLAALTDTGDEVILPTPWYFNHQMWLTLNGAVPVAMPTGADLLPDPGEAAKLITERTKAIVLVTPNNPCGVEYPAGVIQAFFELARDKGIALILDEPIATFIPASVRRMNCSKIRTGTKRWSIFTAFQRPID